MIDLIAFVLLLAGLGPLAVEAAGACGRTPSSPTDWIDASSGADACTKAVCTGPFASCWPKQTAVEDMVLVFSDEFEQSSRSFDGQRGDARWTAMDFHYSSDYAEDQNYKPGQIKLRDGVLDIQLTAQQSLATLNSNEGPMPRVSRNYTSGMLQGWNKFCFTGGLVEFSVQLPGNAQDSGLWAATWLQGNLGRAGHYRGLTGMWPYSYDDCDGSRKLPWSSAPGQRISACDNPKGRGAPEIDVLEYGNFGKGPSFVHTMQMGPVAPRGTSWMAPINPATKTPRGVFAPGASIKGLNTRLGDPYGQMNEADFPRAGSNITDTFTGTTSLGEQHFAGFHRYAVLWEPGQFVRWFLDDQLLFEVNSEALRAMVNERGEFIKQRHIPTEAMYMIINLAMSDRNWAKVSAELQQSLPASMLVEHVRVWQRPGAINVGCDPPGMETRDFISCNADDYLGPGEAWDLGVCSSVHSQDNVLTIAFCSAAGAVAAACIAAMVVMNGRINQAKEQQQKLTPEEQAAVSCRGDTRKREAGCYITSNTEALKQQLAQSRPDLLAALNASTRPG